MRIRAMRQWTTTARARDCDGRAMNRAFFLALFLAIAFDDSRAFARRSGSGGAARTHGVGVFVDAAEATDSLSLANAFERAHESKERREIAMHETHDSAITATGRGGKMPSEEERRDAARAALGRLARGAREDVERARAVEVDKEIEALETYEVFARALERARKGEEEVEWRKPALGSGRYDFSGELMESVGARGIPGSAKRAWERETTEDRGGDSEAMFARFAATRRRANAKARLAPARAWFLKPKQPDVYWDVDLAKIQRAREAVTARADEQGADDFNFEITDMPIVDAEKSRAVAALGSASVESADPAGEFVRDARRGKLASANDASFAQVLDEWTKKAAAGVNGAANKARETASNVAAKAIAAEEDLLMKHIQVKIYADFADPTSLETLLGPYKRLSAMSLGPVKWTIVPFVNVGQSHNASVNCLYNGHARHLSCTANAIAACTERGMQAYPSAMRAFTSCYSVQMLKLESEQAFTFGRHEDELFAAQGQCCEAVMSGLETFNATHDSTIEKSPTCRAQSDCASLGDGYDLLKANAAELGSALPKYTYLPWITIDGEPACEQKCNLQATVRRKICSIRSTLPADCPRFPWAQAWYDEPEVSFAGLAAVAAAVIFVTVSAFVLMREAGLKPLGLFSDKKSGERAGLLPK